MNKEISILIPTHERPQLLDRALDSLINQKNVKINCIVSDNGINEEASSVTKKYSNLSSNLSITYLKNENPKPFQNWKNLISNKIDTQYSKFLFDDDWLVEGSLNTMLNDIESLKADSVVYNTNIYAKVFNFQPINSYYKSKETKLTPNKVINSVLRVEDPFPITPSASIVTTDYLTDSILFSEKNSNCTELAIGNDLIMNYYPTFKSGNSYFLNKNIVNLWGGDDSITINTPNGSLLSFCYLESLIYLIENFEIKTTLLQNKLINHKIFTNNFKSFFDSEISFFNNSKVFKSKLAIDQLLISLKKYKI